MGRPPLNATFTASSLPAPSPVGVTLLPGHCLLPPTLPCRLFFHFISLYLLPLPSLSLPSLSLFLFFVSFPPFPSFPIPSYPIGISVMCFIFLFFSFMEKKDFRIYSICFTYKGFAMNILKGRFSPFYTQYIM